MIKGLLTVTKISRLQLKTICHTKYQKNHNLNERRYSSEANSELNQILELSHDGFNSAIIKLLDELVTDIS